LEASEAAPSPARKDLKNDTADTGQVSAINFRALILRSFFRELPNHNQN
jgi:hypothetical protein